MPSARPPSRNGLRYQTLSDSSTTPWSAVVEVSPHTSPRSSSSGLGAVNKVTTTDTTARAVVEGHHHDAEEHHRRYGADPVEANRRDAVLGAVGGLADDLQRAEVWRR